MDQKINLATRAYVKFKYTDFKSMLQDGKADLYEDLLGSKPFMCRESRNYAYEEFHNGKSFLHDEMDQEVQGEIDCKISEWN